MLTIGRPINGIGINGLEYALDSDGNILLFDTQENAKNFLLEHGIAAENLEYFVIGEETNG